LSGLAIFPLLIGCGEDNTAARSASKAKPLHTLTSLKTSSTIKIDGVVDAPWEKAKSIEVKVNQLPYEPDNGYEGMKETNVRMKSMHDDKDIYFLIEYDDPTYSMQRYPWVKQKDGSWKQLKALDSTIHENTYYEDKLSFLWDINTAGFKKKGCAMSCHMAENGLVEGIPDTSAGRKYTRPGEYLDIWHWKSVRTNDVYQIDDQYVDHLKKEGGKQWGRHNDVTTGGGYVDNINEAGTAPIYMTAKEEQMKNYYVMDKDKIPFKDTFKVGDEIPGIIISPIQGPRGDITAHGDWKDGVWTLEIKRALVTTGEKSELHDIQFDDLTKAYYFGVSVFDNSQINHIYHKKALELTFQ